MDVKIKKIKIYSFIIWRIITMSRYRWCQDESTHTSHKFAMDVKINIISRWIYAYKFKSCNGCQDKHNFKMNAYIEWMSGFQWCQDESTHTCHKFAMDVKINIILRWIYTYKLKICNGCQDRNYVKMNLNIQVQNLQWMSR